MGFDRIKLPTESPVMTVIPWRSAGDVKVHSSMSRARSAVMAQRASWHLARSVREARIYVWRDGAWALEHDIAQGTLVEDLPWKKVPA